MANHLALLLIAPAEPGIQDLGREWHADVLDFLRKDAPKLLLILLLALLLQQLVRLFVRRLRRIADSYVGNSQRAAQLRTFAAILRATSYSLIGFIALLQILPLFSINLGPLLASAGVVGLGISFGAQSLFKDFLNGIFILLEDQFNVGEVVRIATLTGTVEDLSLRKTTLRDGDGTQHFIPNSQITTVSNLSREFAMATLQVSADAAADPDRVLALLTSIASSLRQNAAFSQVIIEDPMPLGIDRVNGREVVYLLNLRVRPLQRDPVLREMRKRVLEAMIRDGIPLGVSSSVLLPPAPDPASTADPAAATGPAR